MPEAPKWANRIVGYGIEDADQLLANPANWRIHPKFQQDSLTGILDTVGWVQNVIVNKRTSPIWGQDRNVETVVDGHLRIALAISRNEQVPVTYVDLDPNEEALILASIDPIAALAATDKDQLDTLLKQVNSDDARVQELLSKLAEDVGLYKEPPAAPDAQIDRAAELQQKWQVERGQLWEIGKHRLLCGDSTSADDVVQVMGGESADAVVTDPPYDISQGGHHDTYGIDVGKAQEFEHFDKGFVPTPFLEILPIACTEETNYLIFTSTYLQWRYYLPHFYELNDVASFIVWVKPYATANVRQVSFTHCFETAVYSWNKGHYFEALHATDNYDVIDMTNNEGGRSYDHPTAKPLALICRLVRQLCPDDGIAYDPFGGSGTTMVACEQLGRQCRMIEIEPKYCAVILERMSAMQLEPRLVE